MSRKTENMQVSIIREPRGVKVGGHAVKGWWYFLLYLGTLLNDFWVDNLLKSPHGPFYAYTFSVNWRESRNSQPDNTETQIKHNFLCFKA